MQVIVLLLTIPVCSCTLGLYGTTQSIGVIGSLKCKGGPASGVKMELEDAEISQDHIDLYQQNRFGIQSKAAAVTDTDGTFMLTGNAKKWSKSDANMYQYSILNIYHKCNYKGRCYRKNSIYIPKEYVTLGKKALKYYNIGSLELSMIPKGETISCSR
ncbi:unnamed protein product [Cylicostephanus goldi]|uniref:Transthyretin-like family protein n=1 Tax=Cylicostephanus goldi TaxID=71465 RepID=A0A3P6QME8_CYLGO|nr:unnamed protein product [Cylicostephanus goldi]